MSLPNIANVLFSWFQNITVQIVINTLENFESLEEYNEVSTKAVIQPLEFKNLRVLSEGHRELEWYQLHCLPNLILKNNDVIIIKFKRYRVMKKKDYSDYGYLEYHIVSEQ